MPFYINTKNYESIVCTDFLNVSIALNLHSNEGNQSFILEFYTIFCCSLNHKLCDTILLITHHHLLRPYSSFALKIGHHLIFSRSKIFFLISTLNLIQRNLEKCFFSPKLKVQSCKLYNNIHDCFNINHKHWNCHIHSCSSF